MVAGTGKSSHIKILWIAFALISLSAVTGCSTVRDRPWDPPHPQQLYEQVPKPRQWARTRCAGHLPPEQRQAHQTGRC